MSPTKQSPRESSNWQRMASATRIGSASGCWTIYASCHRTYKSRLSWRLVQVRLKALVRRGKFHQRYCQSHMLFIEDYQFHPFRNWSCRRLWRTLSSFGFSFGRDDHEYRRAAERLRAREAECELGTLAIGKRCQERISATGWAPW